MKKYYMGIDNGGTISKAVIFDDQGKQKGSASCEIPLNTPREGFTQRDMENLWHANVDIIKNAISDAGLFPDQISSVACTGHGKGLYLWGKDNKPAYEGIVSTDNRAHKYPESWKKDGTAKRVFEKTFQSILACQPVSLLRWFKDNEPNVIENTKWIFSIKDYIRFRLTGHAYAEYTDYSGTNLVNLKTKKYDKDLLKEFGLEDINEKLPPLIKSTDICGRITREVSEITGLLAGTPVAGGMFDIDACAIAMDITNEENIAVIAGTWSINEYISREPVLNGSIMMNSLYCMDDYYLIEECSPTSAGNLAWFIEKFMEGEKLKAKEQGISPYKYFDEMAETVSPDEQNIIFLPYIFGSNYDPMAKATLYGLDSHHTKEHIARAILEGIAFCHMVHMEKLLMNRKNTRAVRLAGGAAKSKIWAQIFADVFGLPVETIDTDELGALGCAMAASVVDRQYPDLKSAAKNMVKIKTRYEPDPSNVKIYEKKFQLYKKVSESIEEIHNSK